MLLQLLQSTPEATPAEDGGDHFKVMGLDFYDKDIWDLLIRFAFNSIVIYLLIKLIYRSDKKNKNYAFTFYVFNTIIFLLCYMMSNVKLDLGFAFGLFAIFSILRYRTISMPLKEMTYLFVTIAIAVINALTTKKISFLELLSTNAILLFTTYFLERLWYKEGLSEMNIEYEKIELIRPEKSAEMMADLRARTGLDIRTFEVMTTDFLRDMAKVKIYFKAPVRLSEEGVEFSEDDDDDD